MVKVHWAGRMGNNMFQYCFGRILATELGYQLACSSIAGFERTKDKVDGVAIDHPSVTLNMHLVDMEGILNKSDGEQRVILEGGYFQRYEYYRPYKKEVKEWMSIEPHDVGQTDDDIIIHMRLGDNITTFHPDRPFLVDFEYFRTALESTSFNKLYVCSDPETLDSPYMKWFDKYDPIILGRDVSFPMPMEHYHSWNPTQLDDFRALRSFNKIICSQSTFSWWGAFLSSAAEIFMPVPQPGNAKLVNEWSSARPDIALFVDDEPRYKYIKEYDNNEWKFVNLEDIEER
jgi:hypothetical protein